MKLLILGGTVFLGRHLVEAALTRGHRVTLFNRGLHETNLFPEVERLRGEREGSLEALSGRCWDAAIDTSGFVPSTVRASAGLLREHVDHYSFISSIAAYANFSSSGMDESAEVGQLTPAQLREAETIKVAGGTLVTSNTYGPLFGPLKAGCEQAAELAMPRRVLNIRPGLIVGPDDWSGRFTYWVSRVAAGGEVLAPGRPERPIQLIDVRDLAEWIVRMIEAKATGTYNATGPDYELTMKRLLDECRDASGSDARFVWVDDQFLLDMGVAAWTEIPLWIPEVEGHGRSGFLSINSGRAIASGLTFRPLAETVRATLEWSSGGSFVTPDGGHQMSIISPDREAELLRSYRASGFRSGTCERLSAR